MPNATFHPTFRFLALPVVTGLFLAANAAAQTATKPLDHDAYDIWNRITGEAITDDGRWILYHLTSEANDPLLHVKTVAGGTEHVIERAEGARFSDDGRFVVFRIKPSKAAVEQAEKDDVPEAEQPQDSLGILHLGSGQVTLRAERLRNFEMPDENGEWLAYQLLRPKADSAAEGGEEAGRAGRGGGQGQAGEGRGGRGGNGADNGERKPEDGYPLVVRNLRTGEETRIEMATDYEFNEDGSRLAYVTATKDGSNDGVHVLTPGGSTVTLLAGKGDYTNVAFDEAGRQVAFLSNRDHVDDRQREFKLYHWDGDAAEAREIAASMTAGVPQGWWVSEFRGPSFSPNGERLFFGTAPRPEPEPEEDEEDDDEEEVVVDIWAWTDPLLQPMQLQRLQQERRRNYTAVVHLDEGRTVQLATPDMPELSLVADGDADVALGRSDLPYQQEISWGESGDDLYLVDVSSGAREMIVEYARSGGSLSPDAKYLAYWDGENRNWNVMDLATKNVADVSAALPHPVYNELHDSPSLPGSYGSAGWTEDDNRFLVYDRYDIWAVDPTGTAAPRSITEGAGRRDGIRFRYIRLDPDEEQIGPQQDLLLSAFHLTTKQSGFYRDRVNGSTPPRQLVMQDARLGGGFGGGVDKAGDADVMMFTRSTFRDFPNIWVSGRDFADMKQLSDANPQQADYSWGTAELYEWRSAMDGQTLQGVLYKPDGFDPSREYPMMVYFYERLSDNLHNHVIPAAGSSSINISFYVSRGYLVFTPDIPYQIGYPGESALKAVVPGVLSLIDEGFVDEDHIGVQGHSWGGYQIAYLVTKTNVFAAAEAGAPVANMTSAYGGIRWGSGMSRMFQYEKTQSRLGGTLWETPVRYIENSPLFWADKVETPVLMMHNDEDGAVPWYQGIEYFVALRRLNKPVWMFNYNGEDHGLRQEHNQKDWAVRMQQYFDHYLIGDPAPVWMAEGVPAIMKGKTLGLELVTEKVTSEQGGGGNR
jgi:dipeptidyl aminopeptidase/acylaminoacyl peptidase